MFPAQPTLQLQFRAMFSTPQSQAIARITNCKHVHIRRRHPTKHTKELRQTNLAGSELVQMMLRFLGATENTQVSVTVPTSLALQLPSAKEQRSTGLAQAKNNPTGSLCAPMLLLKNTTFAIAVMTNECKRLIVTCSATTRSPFLLRGTRGTPKRQSRLRCAELLTL